MKKVFLIAAAVGVSSTPGVVSAKAFIVSSSGQVVVEVQACRWTETEDGFTWEADTGSGYVPMAEGFICDGEDVFEGAVNNGDPRWPKAEKARQLPRPRQPARAVPVRPKS